MKLDNGKITMMYLKPYRQPTNILKQIIKNIKTEVEEQAKSVSIIGSLVQGNTLNKKGDNERGGNRSKESPG